MPRRDGPYVILTQRSPSSYEIASLHNPGKPIGIYHTSVLTPCNNDKVKPLIPLRKRSRPPKVPQTPGSSSGRRRIQRGRIFDHDWQSLESCYCCFKKSGFPSPNLVDVNDTLTKLNAEPSLWEALPEQDLTFDDYVLVDMNIAVWGALSDAEIVALVHNNTESDEDESKELTPVTLSEAKVSINTLRNFFLQNHVDADILQASFVLEKSIDKVRLNALNQKKKTDFLTKRINYI
ncbi:tigger transposable element-derived protein 6 [Trichonephila clavipes]|nr:tigger transposable element-derived protein 6 [Trichonephila clavipes]